jgi:phenylacetate-CoA ligase
VGSKYYFLEICFYNVSTFDVSLHLNGFPIQEAKAELRKIVAFTESEHTAFVNHKKKEIVDFHLQ